MARDEDDVLQSEWELLAESFDAGQSGSARPNILPLNAATVVAGVAQTDLPELARVEVPPALGGPWVVTLAPMGVGGGNQPNFLAPNAGGGTFGPVFTPMHVLDNIAIVRWSGGRRGASAFAVVDWPSAGVQFSVWGAFVSVQGGSYFADTLNGFENTPEAAATQAAHITRGFSSRLPFRTVHYGLLAGAEAVQLAVPPFARRVTLNVTTTSTAGMILNGKRAPVAGASFWRRTAAQAQLGFDLPVGTNFIELVNGALPNQTFTLLYELGLS